MRSLRRAAPATLWTVRGSSSTLDGFLDLQVRRTVGAGCWTRRCAACGAADHGARIFVPADGSPAVAVSISHAGSVHVAATAWGRIALGVDLVAEAAPNPDHGAWLKPWIAPGSLARLSDLPSERRDVAALTLWAAREAAAKCDGTGLDDTPAAVPLLAPARSRRVVRARRHPGTSTWWVRWPKVPGHICVLAGTGPFRVGPGPAIRGDASTERGSR